MEPSRLMTSSLVAHPRGDAVARVLAAALTAVDPGAAVHRALQRDGERLMVGDANYDLRRIGRVVALAIGKAGMPMLMAVAEVLGERLEQGLAVIKDGHGETGRRGDGETGRRGDRETGRRGDRETGRLAFVEAGHPVPDARGVAAAERAINLLAGLTERDLGIVLVSGGGSALFTRPAPGVTLDDLQILTRELLACGATINEINTLRKHLDLVKGGGLARLAGPARLAVLVLSDVVGDPLDVIASGPTVGDPSTFADAYAILERYTILERVPAPIMSYLRRGMAGEAPESLKPGDTRLARVQHVLVGSNRLAAEAALAAAHKEGFAPLLLTTRLQGEAREVGRVLAAIECEAASSGHPLRPPCCIVAGGETTVTLRGQGRGGRNQELALAAVEALADIRGALFVTLATDGGDGPTDAAGAVVTDATLARARALGLEPAVSLARNDAYSFFDALGDLLKPGPTRTNVNDLALMFVCREA